MQQQKKAKNLERKNNKTFSGYKKGVTENHDRRHLYRAPTIFGRGGCVPVRILFVWSDQEKKEAAF
jgi:hypothetical protein